MISLPVYRMASGVAERATRRRMSMIMRPGLVSQTSRKKRGRLVSAAILSFQVSGSSSLGTGFLIIKITEIGGDSGDRAAGGDPIAHYLVFCTHDLISPNGGADSELLFC